MKFSIAHGNTVEGTAPTHTMSQPRWVTRILVILAGALVLASVVSTRPAMADDTPEQVGSPQVVNSQATTAVEPSPSAVASCGNGRCTLYMSINETKALGRGIIPPLPAWVPWQIQAAYRVSAVAHRWFASVYGSRNWCSAFVLDIRPWATQGYYGYPCSWW